MPRYRQYHRRNQSFEDWVSECGEDAADERRSVERTEDIAVYDPDEVAAESENRMRVLGWGV